MYNKILVPLDGSASAEMILPQIEAFAKSMHAEVVLFGVGANPDSALSSETTPIAKQSAVVNNAGAGSNLARVANELRTKGLHVSTMYRQGRPAQEIIDYASDVKCDLIAMATRGRGRVAWMLKSVAEKVASHATVPVLLLRVMEKGTAKKNERRFDPREGSLSWGSE